MYHQRNGGTGVLVAIFESYYTINTQICKFVAALKAEAPQRVTELARPKRFAEGYEPCRGVVWKVSPGARNAVASARQVTNEVAELYSFFVPG